MPWHCDLCQVEVSVPRCPYCRQYREDARIAASPICVTVTPYRNKTVRTVNGSESPLQGVAAMVFACLSPFVWQTSREISMTLDHHDLAYGEFSAISSALFRLGEIGAVVEELVPRYRRKRRYRLK